MTSAHELDPALYEAFVAAKAERDQAQQILDNIRHKLLETIPSPDDDSEPTVELEIGGVSVGSATRVVSMRIDAERLRREYPDVYSMYIRPTRTTRLVIK